MNKEFKEQLKQIDEIEKNKNIISAMTARKLMIEEEETIKELKNIEKLIKANLTEGCIVVEDIKMSTREYLILKGYKVDWHIKDYKIEGPVTISWYTD